MMKKLIFSFFSFFFLIIVLKGQENYQVRYEYDLYYKNKETNTWQQSKENSQEGIVGVQIDCPLFFDVQICSPAELNIWVAGQRLATKKKKDRCRVLTPDEICQYAHSKHWMVIAFSNEIKEVKIASIEKIKPLISHTNPQKRKPKSASQFTIFGFLLMGILLLTLKKFNPFLDWRLMGFVDFKKDVFLNWNFILPSFIFLLIITFCWSFGVNGVTFWPILPILLVYALFKIAWSFITALVFRVKDLANWQWVNFTRQIGLIALGFFIFFFIRQLFFSTVYFEIYTFNLLMLMLISFVIISQFIILILQTNTKNLYLFIYFCSSEILPLLFIIQWVSKVVV